MMINFLSRFRAVGLLLARGKARCFHAWCTFRCM